jgi:hypothetical protein
MEMQKAILTVINKAWDDAQFLATLVASPKAAIATATGLKVPDDVDIVVSNMSDANKVYITIPPKPNFDDMELTDEQLEQVAGGEVAATIVLSLMAASAVVSGGVTVNAANKAIGKKHW